jgi:hypothetical protein
MTPGEPRKPPVLATLGALLAFALVAAWILTSGINSLIDLVKGPPPPPAAKAPATAPVTAPLKPVSARRLTPPWPGKSPAEAAISTDLFAKNYYVVLDASGSMAGKGCSGGLSKFDAARNALAEFARSIPPEANLGLQVFDTHGVREVLPLGTGNRERFTAALQGVRPNGNTPLQTSVRHAYAKLMERGGRQLGYGEYHLVMVTDGEADPGEDPSAVVSALLAQSPVVLHTIGFCIGEQHSLNQRGRTLYRAADNPEQLRAGLAEVLAEAPAFADAQFGK